MYELNYGCPTNNTKVRKQEDTDLFGIPSHTDIKDNPLGVKLIIILSYRTGTCSKAVNRFFCGGVTAGCGSHAGLLSRHRHPGPVHGFVLKGDWKYLEHEWTASQGSYIFEPPGEQLWSCLPDNAIGGGMSYWERLLRNSCLCQWRTPAQVYNFEPSSNKFWVLVPIKC
jgi:hypothetical protein